MKTTKQHLEYFKQRCLYWQNCLNLKQWRLYFDHIDDEDSYAMCRPNFEGKCATISLAKDWGNEKVTTEQLNLSAKHEMCHLLLQPLKHCADSRFITEKHIADVEEEITRLLEKLIA